MSFQEYTLDLGPLFYSPMDNVDFNGEVEEILNFTTSDPTTATTVEAGGAVGSDYSIDVDGEGPVNFPLSTAGAVTHVVVVYPQADSAQDIFTTNEDIISVTAGYERIVLADGPTGYWRLGEESGATVAVDSSGNGNDMNRVGSGGTHTFGVSGALVDDDDTALRLHGGIEYFDNGYTRSGDGGNPFTLELWAKPESSGSNDYVLHEGNTADGSPISAINWSNEAWRAFLRDDAGTLEITSTGAGTLGEWQHVVFTYDGDIMRVYVNGILEGSRSIGPMTITLNFTRLSGRGGDFDGEIDEAAVYDRVLTADEVSNHYNTGKTRSAYLDINGDVSPLFDATRWSVAILNNGTWTIEQLNEEEATGLLVQNIAIFDTALTAAEVDDLVELAQNGYTIEQINEGATLQLTDTGATGLAADWHIISV